MISTSSFFFFSNTLVTRKTFETLIVSWPFGKMHYMQALKENQSYLQKAEVAQDTLCDHTVIKPRCLKK